MTDLEALYAAPSATVPPRTPAEHLQAASLLAFATNTPTGNALGWWLRDTALIHFPDSSGRTCERDGDDWPCQDISAAQKFTELANTEGEIRLCPTASSSLTSPVSSSKPCTPNATCCAATSSAP